MRNLLFAALLLLSVSAVAHPLSVHVMNAVQAQAAATDEDEDDPAPAAATPTPAASTPAPAAATITPSASPSATPVAPATASADAQRLVSGAPLFNPNVDVHIVEKKAYSDSGKFEIALYPAAFQVNGKFTQHVGTWGSFLWHLQENFALQLSGGGNWFNAESGFNGELVEKWRVEAQAASSLLLTWGATAGFEVTPLYGKFALFEGTLVHFSVVINGGAGLGGTRHLIKPKSVKSDGSVVPETYGDTGIRFMGQIGAGFRVQIGERFALRLEVRDVVYAARMQAINGCDTKDLKLMKDTQDMGRPLDSIRSQVSGACKIDTFIGEDENGVKRSINVPLAYNLVKIPSSDVLSNVGLYLGISFLF
jgi:outer membrane beta-barrel protein